MSTSAYAEDATVYAGGAGAMVEWRAYGDHLYITDLEADGQSAVGIVQLGNGTAYYYWNTDGNGTTRHVNLNLPENRPLAVGAAVGNYQGTPTGGLIWSSVSTKSVSTSYSP
ncbi:hypothetical protein SSPO_039990 [Streptomyces antimycoticus]|uniref:Uncharacterized protein n=1 Tax=Streptomyces antimycoticus TaxID=68175 RepID=A0A499UVI3_9ACTN|nr:hypothetical protein SSPO_039990 [Streptomyces antimycoticus]